MIKVSNIVEIYGLNQKSLEVGEFGKHKLEVLSDSNDDYVHLLIEGKYYKVLARDLNNAVKNATNIGR